MSTSSSPTQPSANPSSSGSLPLRGIPNPRRAAEISQIVLAILAFGAAFTHLGPVLQPFLVAVFLFHAIRFLMRLLTGLRMSPWSAFVTLIGLGLIGSILLVQFVYRESGLFLQSWPRYEERIVAFLGEWSPEFLADSHRDSVGSDRSATSNSPSGPANDVVAPPTDPSIFLPRESDPVALTPVPDDPSTVVEKKPQAAKSSLELTPDLVSAQPAPQPAGDSANTPSASPETETESSQANSPRPVSQPLQSDRGLQRRSPERPTLAGSALTDLFRISSNDVLNYVFSHGMDAAELIVMVFFYLIFLFLGTRKFEQRVERAFPGERAQRVLAVGHGISESMERFMMVKTVVGLGMAVTSAIIMWSFGLDHWLLWAFLFFASNYITYIGSIAACLPPCVMAFLDLDSTAFAVVLGILIILNRLFWIDFVELKMSGRQLNLDPTLLFLWLAYWGWSWGILGLILAYPMMAAVRIALLHIEEARGWSVMLSDE